MSHNKSDIELLAGLEGGGQISGKSGQKILNQLNNIVGHINKGHPLEFKIEINKKSISDFKNELENLTKLAKAEANAIKSAYKGIQFPNVPSNPSNSPGGSGGGSSGGSSSGSGGNSDFTKAKNAINGYFKALADVDKRLGRDIYFNEHSNRWESVSKEFQYLADNLTEAERRFDTFASAAARASLSAEDQARLIGVETDAYNKYGITVEDAAEKVRAAAEKSSIKAAIAEETSSLKAASQAAKDYYNLLSALDSGDYDITDDGSQYTSKSGNYAEFALQLTEARNALRLAEQAVGSMTASNQASFFETLIDAIERYNIVIEEKATRDRKAEEAARAAAEKAEREQAIKDEAAALKEATSAAEAYYKLLAKLHTEETDITDDGSQYTSKSGNYAEFALQLTEARNALRLAEQAVGSMTASNQASFFDATTNAVERYNVSIEEKANKDRLAAEATNEHLTSSKTVASQVDKLDKLIRQNTANLKKWSAAKTGKSSSHYKAIEDQVEAWKDLREKIISSNTALDDFDEEIGRSTVLVSVHSGAIEDAGDGVKSLSDKLKGLADKFGFTFSLAETMQKLIQLSKQMVENVTEIDTAMTELRKVTNETSETYADFLEGASERAENLGATVKDVVTSSADFARLGHDLDAASNLADVAIVYKNVGDGIESISAASESIISTMQAFKIEAMDAISIVDKFNIAGKKFARQCSNVLLANRYNGQRPSAGRDRGNRYSNK